MNHRKTLNTDQLKVLALLHKFRFGSNDLFAKYFGKKDRSFVYKRLQILLEQGLIGKRFDGSYRLRGKPAAYYLLPEGVRVLQKARPDMTINIKVMYKNKTVSEEFVESCLALFGIYCRMHAPYGDNLRFFTRHQLAGRYDYFDEFVPSAYMRLDDGGEEKDFFLEYFDATEPWFAVKQRVAEYITYSDSREWEDGTGSEFPAILLVCENLTIRERLLKSSARILEDASDDLRFFISTKGSPEWLNLNPINERKSPAVLFPSAF